MKIIDIYADWFRLHDHRRNSATQLTQYTEGTNRFYFNTALQETISPKKAGRGVVPYKIVLGYVVVAGRLNGRIWYYSGSEASWRASTGFRDLGAWMKGAEELSAANQEEKDYTLAGYVNECYVTNNMSDALDDFWGYKSRVGQNGASNISKADDNGIFPFRDQNHQIDMALIRTHQGLADYILSGATQNYASGLESNYHIERQFRPANLPNLDQSIIELTKKTGSTTIQRGYDIGANLRRTGVGNQLKGNTDLNQWILTCLDRRVGNPRRKHHPVLNEHYDVYSYSLRGIQNNAQSPGNNNCQDDLIVEIAAGTNPKTYKYKTLEDGVINHPTRTCWVRSVYYEHVETSSFGTPLRIPANLAFLVQKPCDYSSQMSALYKETINFTKTDTLGGKYAPLALLNEATSELIRTFKAHNQYPIFRGKNSLFVQQVILKGIDEYDSLNGERNRANAEIKNRWERAGRHSDSGKRRAAALRLVIQNSTTYREIDRAIHQCFVENLIGDFRGGLFSGINTNPRSLFTCVCRHLLSNFVQADPASRPRLLTEMPYFDRMITYISNINPPPDINAEQLITRNAAGILLALRNRPR